MEPAWLLHHRPFRDSSQILDVLSRDHGFLSLVARGVRGRKSKLQGMLRPFMPLQLSWVIRTDLGTLTGAEMHGAPIGLGGEALLAGFYINELILKLVHRHDPQPEIFAAYATTVESLAACTDVSIPLRRFEIVLLRILGYALNLDHDTTTQQPLEPDRMYEYRVEQGPVAVADREGKMIYSGAALAGNRSR